MDVRVASETMQAGDTKRIMLELAGLYEKLADHVAQLAREARTHKLSRVIH